MQKIYFCLSFILGFSTLSSQETLWQRDIKSNSQDFLSSLSITLDRQFLISGSTIQESKISGVSSDGASSQNNGYDYHLIKLNQQGNPVWEKYYGGSMHDFLISTAATQEGGFLLAGTSFSSQGIDKKENAKGGSDIWLIKVTDQGNEEWQKTIGSEMDEEAKSIVQSDDLGYFITGNIQSYKGGIGSKDALVLKLDKAGKTINQIILGGTGYEEVEKIIPTKDGGALLAIYSRSGDATTILSEKRAALKKINTEILEAEKGKSTAKGNENSPMLINELYAKEGENYGEGDYWIVKLDKTGKVEWQKNYGGKEDDHIRTLSNTDKGFLIGGESRSSSSGNKMESIKDGTDLWMVSLDENGNELWQKSYSFSARDVLMSQNTIWNAENTESKGFLLGGYSQAEGEKESKDETFWMLYIDQKGNEVWRKHVEGKSRKNEERLVASNLNSDGTYILAGTSAEELGKENWKIVMLGDKQVAELIEKQNIKIYPNPVDDYCYVEIGVEFKEVEIGIYDMSGKQIQKLKTKNAVTQLNTSSLPQGIYVVTANTGNNKLNAKIIKR